MTEPPQGRDQSPAVAALAVRVDGLRRRVETLATSIDDLTSTQQEHATVLDGIAELRRQVEQILAILGNDDEPNPGRVVLAHHDRPATRRAPQRTIRLGRNRPAHPVPRLPRRPDQALLAQPPRSHDGNSPGSTSSGPAPTSPAGQPPKTPPTGTTAGPPASSAAWPRSCASARKHASASQATKRPQIHSAGNGSDPRAPRTRTRRQQKASRSRARIRPLAKHETRRPANGRRSRTWESDAG